MKKTGEKRVFKRRAVAGTSRRGGRKAGIPEGLWTKCESEACGQVIFNQQLEENLRVCPACGHHFPLGARARIAALVDEGTFEECDRGLRAVDSLGFPNYADRLGVEHGRRETPEAVVCGTGSMGGVRVSLAVMDFTFLGGSMGAATGEKIARAVARAESGGRALVIVSASGGARMHEGCFSLMQMAKISGELQRLAEARLPYISVLTHPTTGGVTASFATLGDLIIAEPGAMIGFAGPRVIRETTHQELPEGFQTAEFLLERGLIDRIVSRREMRDTIARFLGYLLGGA
ncbi:MAG: acetyl-CoA carboxylase carboxyltransferase subunit beta [Verrucomicrobiae bacterium]|nr:acetyl-CoA carboxylase carboxyltransferase subunit beta [Verrucomicrobiae bacterium]